jgi:hypothetical protein
MSFAIFNNWFLIQQLIDTIEGIFLHYGCFIVK